MISVYSRPFGKVICHRAATDDPLVAIDAVARQFNKVEGLQGCSSRSVNMQLSSVRVRWSLGPFFAVVPHD
jgi:hypothetical protein